VSAKLNRPLSRAAAGCQHHGGKLRWATVADPMAGCDSGKPCVPEAARLLCQVPCRGAFGGRTCVITV